MKLWWIYILPIVLVFILIMFVASHNAPISDHPIRECINPNMGMTKICP